MTISHIFEGRRNAHKVTIPMISKTNPKSSTSPGLRQHLFLCFIPLTSYAKKLTLEKKEHTQNEDQSQQNKIPNKNRNGMYDDYRTSNSHYYAEKLYYNPLIHHPNHPYPQLTR